MILSIIKDYFLNSTLHGLRFIAEDNRHITERLFWAVCCLMSWYASALLMGSSWFQFQNNAISFAMETTYLEFHTHFPMVAICESPSRNRTNEIAERARAIIGDFGNTEVCKQLSHFRLKSSFIIDNCFRGRTLEFTGNCTFTNLSMVARAFRLPCEEVMENCKWKGEPFNCCDQFVPLETEMGICFAINSIHASREGISEPPLDMRVNSSTGPGSLYIEFLTNVEAFVLSRYEVPQMNTKDRNILRMEGTMIRHRAFTVQEVFNERDVHDLSIGQRRCRFPYENNLAVYDKYSYSGCIVQCRKDAMMKLCNCSTHQMPKARPEEHCNLREILCIGSHEDYLSVLRSSTGVRNALFCPCTTSCEDQIITSTYGSLTYNNSMELKSTLLLEQQNVPTERFKRYVVRGPLDMVVSMGGATGLFVGASLLSFAEIIYYFTARAYASVMLKRRSKKEEQQQGPLLPLRRRRNVSKSLLATRTNN
ncbi:sodium channel protein Nach-like [Schistocerca serialis cubense]|uniref:sodium channel protein Nach-like n=1 Tax=Schistocerca serialis cubense TaxID=2023355 RepID=UPI00214F4577|nr:sodium channel protein Nach-like [Schistocerca serialis cubense]